MTANKKLEVLIFTEATKTLIYKLITNFGSFVKWWRRQEQGCERPAYLKLSININQSPITWLQNMTFYPYSNYFNHISSKRGFFILRISIHEVLTLYRTLDTKAAWQLSCLKNAITRPLAAKIQEEKAHVVAFLGTSWKLQYVRHNCAKWLKSFAVASCNNLCFYDFFTFCRRE